MCENISANEYKKMKSTLLSQKIELPDTKYSVLFKKVKVLKEEGKKSQRKIAKELGMDIDTVGRYFKLDVYPYYFYEPLDEKNITLLFVNFGKTENEVQNKFGEK